MTRIQLWRWGLALLILSGLGWQLAVHVSDDWSALATPAPLPLGVAATAATASYIAMATAWARLRHRGESWVDVGAVWFPSLLARYVPGGIWQGAARAAEGRARGERIGDNVAAFLSEQALACFSAASLALLTLPIDASLPAVLIAALVGVTLSAAAVPRMLDRLGKSVHWPTSSIGWTMTGHTLLAAGFAAFAACFVPADSMDHLLVARAFLIAGLAGLLAIFVPAGLGVREAVLAWMLAPRMGLSVALAIALASRVGLLACEVAAWGVWAAVRSHLRRP